MRISEIVRSKRGITADTALRLGRYFGLSAAYWMNLQALYEIEIAEDFLEDRLEEEVTPREEVAALIVPHVCSARDVVELLE